MVRFATNVLAALLCAVTTASAQWSSNPATNNPICTVGGNQRVVRIISDGKGGAIMTWEDERPQVNTYDIYAQRIDAGGNVKWQMNGAPVCTVIGSQNKPQIAPDGNGGAWIVWKDIRNLDNDIFIQHLDSTGAMLGPSDGIDLVPPDIKLREQSDPTICPDGAGGAYVAYMDHQAGGNFDNQIMIVRVDANGGSPWISARYLSPITQKAGMYQYMPVICADGARGAIVAWQWFFGGPSGYYDLYAQRIDANGNLYWGKKGIGLCTGSGNQGYPTIDSDGLKGAVTAWPDFRSTVVAVYTQRLDSSGNKKWPESKVTTTTGATDHPTIVGMGGGTAVVAWEDSRNGSTPDIFAQFFDAAGAAKWTANGVAVCTAMNGQYLPYVCTDGQGGVIIAWEDRRSGTSNPDIYAQRLDASGNPMWTQDGILICSAANTQTSPVAVSNGTGGGIFAWEDYRSGYTNANIYAFSVLADGTYPKTRPGITISSRSLDFGVIGVGQKRDRVVNFSNSGGDTLHITSVMPTNPAFIPKITSAVLPSGTAMDDTIRFVPTAIGQISAFVIITSDSWSSPDTIRVTGTGTGMAVLDVQSKKLAFGYVKVGAKKDSAVVFANAGLDTLRITAANPSNAAVTITPGAAVVAPGKSVTQTIRFSPKVAGNVNARITIQSNALTSPDTVFVAGTGTLDVNVALTPRTIDFGTLPVGTRADTVIDVQNNGGDTLRVASIISDNPAVVSIPGTFKTPPLTTYKLRVRCVPAALGPMTGHLIMNANSTSAPDTITVIATGDKDVVFAPAAIVFGTVDIGGHADTVLTICNLKADTLRVTAIASDHAAFTVFPSSLVVPPGFTLTDTIRFAPYGIGAADGTVTFTSNSISAPDRISVTGIGRMPTSVDAPAAAEAFTLGRSYPNPTAASTRIPYSVHRAGRIALRIENVLGRTVAVLVDELRVPGSYTASWDASAVPPGVYRCVLSADAAQSAGIVLVVR